MNATPWLRSLPPVTTSISLTFRKPKMKILLFVLVVALSGCASPQTVPTIAKLPPTPAWILEPGPNLQQMLDKIILPYVTGLPSPAPSLPPAKTN